MPGKVGHDRIQQGRAAESIGESIRKWFNLSSGDFERIDVNIEIVDQAFYLTPLLYKYAGQPKEREIAIIERPLTFTKDYASPFWRRQLDSVEAKKAGMVLWSLAEICRIVKDHKPPSPVPHLQEQDILRASGPLKHLGLALGPYVGKGYDCLSEFTFLDYPTYAVPVEIKKRSKGFKYQQKTTTKTSFRGW
jgi:hypothetical protein